MRRGAEVGVARMMLRASGTTRRLLEKQLVVVTVLGSGKKSGAMWHV